MLAVKTWHLAPAACVPVASHVAFLDLRIITLSWMTGLVVVRLKGQTKCERTLQVSATTRIYGKRSLDFARLWQITLALCLHAHLKASASGC